jgi:hypothetical protein
MEVMELQIAAPISAFTNAGSIRWDMLLWLALWRSTTLQKGTIMERL